MRNFYAVLFWLGFTVILPACTPNFWSMDFDQNDSDTTEQGDGVNTGTQTESSTDESANADNNAEIVDEEIDISIAVATDEAISTDGATTSAIEVLTETSLSTDVISTSPSSTETNTLTATTAEGSVSTSIDTPTATASVPTSTTTARPPRTRTRTSRPRTGILSSSSSTSSTTESDSATATSSSTSSSTDTDTSTETATDSGTETATAEPVSYDLTSELPSTASSSDCEISGGALQIKKSGSTFADSCSVSFAVDNDDVSTKMISVSAERVNLFDAASFDGLSATDVLLYNAATTANDAAEATGKWFSSATYPSKKPSITDGTATLTKYGSLVQFFKVTPGTELELSFGANVSAIDSDQLLYLATSFYDENFKALTFYNPQNDTTATTLGNYINYGVDDGDFTDIVRLKALACDDVETYAGGAGVATTSYSVSLCESAGVALTNSDGTAYTEDDITYASIQFAVNWSATKNGTADLKWAELHDMQEIRFEVLSADGSVLAEGYGGDTFYVPEITGATTLKVTLRTLKNSESPKISALTLGDATLVSVSVGSKKIDADGARLAGLNNFGPRSEWSDGDVEQRSLCVDPLTGETLSCFAFAARYNASSNRLGFYQSYFNVALDSTGNDYEFTLNDNGEVFLKRLIEYNEGGVDFNILLIKTGGYMYNSPTDSKSYAVATDGSSLTDPTGTRSATEQGAYMLEKYARTIAAYFTGTKSYTFQYVDAGRTVTLPKIEDWEIFNEDNITETTWAGLDAWGKVEDPTSAAAVAAVIGPIMNDMASAIKESVSDAQIAYASFAANYGPVINTDDLDIIVPHIDTSLFGINHFHPYVNGDPIHGMEELIKERWKAAAETLAKYGIDNYRTEFGEYGFTREIYDPACVYNSTTRIYDKTTTPNLEWSRGYGETEHGKLFARQSIALLSLPVSRVKPYGSYTGEAESWGKTINSDGSGGFECWRSFPAVNFWYFKRVSGTGILSGIDEATTYTLTSGGIAHTVLAKYLSVSDPNETSATTTLADNEHLNVDAFTVSDGAIIALSYYRNYDFAVDFMDYVSGVKDNGFTDFKIIDVTPTGVSFSTAKLISLVDGSETNLTVEDGIVKSVPVGAMPVLIKLQ